MSKFDRFLREVEALGNRHNPRPAQRPAPRPGITHAELRKAFQPREGNKFAKAIAHAKRLHETIKVTLQSPEEKRQIAAQGRLQHQRVVLQKLGEMREQVKQALIAGELTGDEASALETRLNSESERLNNKLLATLQESGTRTVGTVQSGGGR